jgi:hypothetical protein
MRGKIFGAIFLFLGLLVALTPRYILPTCEFYGRPKMACSYTAGAELFAGLIIVAKALASLFSKTSETLRWLMFVAFFAGISVLLIPEVLGYCPSSQMPCHYGTVPMIRLLGGLAMVSSIAGFFLSGDRRQVSSEAR